MKVGLYQIHDRVAQMPATPIVSFQRPEAAIRWYQELAMGNQDNPIKQYPQDHDLLQLGTQDLETAAIEASEPTTIYTGRAYLEQLEREQKLRAARSSTPVTSSPALVANDNGATNASEEVLPMPSPEELACQNCNKHWTMHINNGNCPDNTGRHFKPTAALQQHYRDYLDSRAQQG